MLRALGLSRSRREARNASTKAEFAQIVADGVSLEQALLAMDTVLNGQIDQAKKLLHSESGVYKQIATGVLHFIEATVSFETEAIMQAVHSLGISESAAAKAKDQAQAEGLATSIFRPGTEYELVELESSLLCAISMLLTESKIETLKALYKIRKTYLALEELRKHVESTQTPSTMSPESAELPDLSQFKAIRTERTQRSQEPLSGPETPAATVEEYVRSGVEACAGLLHLILSSVPPNIAKLLAIVGLHGDRETALHMLWHCSKKYRNIHGSLALIALIMFFDSQLQYKDILLSKSEEDEISEKYANKSKSAIKTTAKMTPRELNDTKAQLMVALRQQRLYYPNGVLWLLQEGRMVTLDDLSKGVAILESPECGPNQMRQVEGLLMFDRTMFLLSLDRLDEAKTAFIKLMDVSTWSHPLYYYLSAACHIELYRQLDDKTSAEAIEHKTKIGEYFNKAPHVAKKKLLGKKMPFDLFVTRKIDEISHVAAKYNVDIADAVETSPLYEALYFWNAPSRMAPDVAARAINRLAYSADAKVPESKDQKFTRQLLQSVYMRQTNQQKEGFEIIKNLSSQAVSGDTTSKGGKVSYHQQKQPWSAPASIYERAVYEFVMNGKSHAKQTRRWLDLCADWPEDYELSTRINMKVTGARDRLDIYRL